MSAYCTFTESKRERERERERERKHKITPMRIDLKLHQQNLPYPKFQFKKTNFTNTKFHT